VAKPHGADQHRHEPAVLVSEVVFHRPDGAAGSSGPRGGEGALTSWRPSAREISSDAPGTWAAGQAVTTFTAVTKSWSSHTKATTFSPQ
jgi:hypothetical protein